MNPLHPPDPQNPKKSPPRSKFITRNLIITSKTNNVIRKVCLKRLAIKNFINTRGEDHNGTKDLASKLFKNKSFKTLQSISLSSVSQDYLRNNLKTCKNIKKIELTSSIEMDKAAMIFKKLSRNVQRVQLKDITPSINFDKSFYEFVKTALRFPKLQYFNRNVEASGNNKYFQKELKIYNHFASRLKEIKKVSFGFSSSEVYEFQAAMQEGHHVYSGINGLIMRLELDGLFHEIGHEVFNLEDDDDTLYADIPYDLEDQGDDPTDRKVIMKQRMREEIKPFFRFELFPNLNKLDITQECSTCTLTSFVGYGFEALKSLQELKVCFGSRSANTMYLFKQLSQLPLLRKFSLSLPFIKIEEWALLEKFLKDQENLDTLSICLTTTLCARAYHLEQKAFLTSIIKNLANKPLLKSLELQSPFWSLEALSNGFSHLNMMNQLHTLIIQGGDDIVTSDEEPWKRVSGLCSFLNNQKGSLKTLKISLLHVLHDRIINNIAKAISTLSQLRELEILINYHKSYQIEDFGKYFMETLRENKEKKKVIISKKLTPTLAKYLAKLENLEDFTIGFELLEEEPAEWFMDIMKMLPELKTLRRFRIAPKSFGSLQPVEQKMVHAVLQLKNIREFTDEFDHYFEFLFYFASLKKAIRSLNERQSFRSDLMFETTVKEYAPRFIFI